MKWVHRVSELFQPVIIVPKSNILKTELVAKSHQLMVNAGIISSLNTGMHALLPLGMKVLEKLIQIVEKEMMDVGGQKVMLPVLTSSTLWRQTSRLVQAKPELFLLNDRHGKQYILSPTFEEAITNMISRLGPLKRNQLPLKLYQISSKWRDEMKPRFGLLRSREFIMKDMYTFDVDSKSAKCTYAIVNKAYEKIFQNIGIPYVKVIADTGVIGGSISHEYRYLSDIGEDVTLSCKSCNHYEDNSNDSKMYCPTCKGILSRNNSIEIGHTFLLDSRYSEPLEATYVDSNNQKKFLSMGCYGLGLSRIIAAVVEILSTDSEIRWPLALAPFRVCIIPPKSGSKEETITHLAYSLYENLYYANIDAIIDDRSEMTIGHRFIEARKCGYPFVIVVGKNCLKSIPKIEVHNMYHNTFENLLIKDGVGYLSSLFEKHVHGLHAEI